MIISLGSPRGVLGGAWGCLGALFLVILAQKMAQNGPKWPKKAYFGPYFHPPGTPRGHFLGGMGQNVPKHTPQRIGEKINFF